MDTDASAAAARAAVGDMPEPAPVDTRDGDDAWNNTWAGAGAAVAGAMAGAEMAGYQLVVSTFKVFNMLN